LYDTQLEYVMDRKLAAILAADVVGYSALMERDEAGTFARLKAGRKELFEPEIARHHGRVFKTMGDGMLAEFGSVVDAVECAVALQRGLAERNATVPENQRFAVRIGINLGEVIVEGRDRYGEGVNIAARLQELAPPGGICVSGKVAKEVERKLAFGFEPMGEQKVKNIAEPVLAFRVKLDGLPKYRPMRSRPRRLFAVIAVGFSIVLAAVYGIFELSKPAGPPLPEKPSIAVLPFDNLSGDERLGRLADGMVTDITNNLSRFSELFVIARSSTFTYRGKSTDVRQIGRELGVRYILEGTVQGGQDKFRVSTQLVEATTGNQLWSERYDRLLKDLFVVQSDIMERVVGSIGSTRGAVQEAMLQQTRGRAPRDLEVYDLTLIADDLRLHLNEGDNAKATEAVRRALAKDPLFEPAWVVLALCNWNRVDYAWGDVPQAMKDWLEAAKRAIELDPGDAMAHTALGLRYEFANDFPSALREFNAALEVNPNHARAVGLIGGNLVFLEKSDRAVELVERAMRLNPRTLPLIGHMSKLAYFFAGNFLKTISEIHLRDEFSLYDFIFLALAHAELGQTEEAQKYAADVLKSRRDLSAELYLAETDFAPAAAANRALFLDGWKKAGLPYCATLEQLAKHPSFVRLPECIGQHAD
jgi:TolB-like protein/class 3 adenylate cyclase